MQHRICPHCGESISGLEKICPCCGEDIHSNVVRCPHCGEMTDSRNERCVVCDELIVESQSIPVSQPDLPVKEQTSVSSEMELEPTEPICTAKPAEPVQPAEPAEPAKPGVPSDNEEEVGEDCAPSASGRSRRRGLMIVICMLGAVLLGVVVYLFLNNSSKPAATGTTGENQPDSVPAELKADMALLDGKTYSGFFAGHGGGALYFNDTIRFQNSQFEYVGWTEGDAMSLKDRVLSGKYEIKGDTVILTSDNHSAMYLLSTDKKRLNNINDDMDMFVMSDFELVEGSGNSSNGDVQAIDPPTDSEYMIYLECEYNDDYVTDYHDISWLSKRKATEYDLQGFSSNDLRLLRNAIFAMHGFKFKSPELQQYFSQFDWYEPMYDDVTSQLTEIEKANISIIKQREAN